MASLLRQIVAGPRAKHEETGLDLCYVTSNIIATSGPSQTYPQRAYRNPLDRLVAFLDAKHGDGWAIWEFRAEGTGYPDEAVYNRIRHYPWPDHHPPPFRLVPLIVASMREWINGSDLLNNEKGREATADQTEDADRSKKAPENTSEDSSTGSTDVAKQSKGSQAKKAKSDRVIVVHCKAGKGRSGTASCSYLISECGWTAEDALARFTERRMRKGFGSGISIPSQLRTISYVDRWTRHGKRYIDRAVDIVEIHVWGLRHGVKVAVEGFVDEGKRIEVFHTFSKHERFIIEGNAPGSGGMMDMVADMAGYGVQGTEDEDGEVAENADYHDITNGEAKGGENGKTGEGNLSSSTGPTRSKSKKLRNAKTTSLIRRLSKSSDRLSSMNDKNGKRKSSLPNPQSTSQISTPSFSPSESAANVATHANISEPGGRAVIFKPVTPVRVPNCDINITLERRNRAPASMGMTMVTAVAHVWFNTFFEGNGPEQDGKPDDSGVFEIEWDKMDGIKGSSRKGTRACDKIAILWRAAGKESTAREDTGKAEGSAPHATITASATAAGDVGAGAGTEAAEGIEIREPGQGSPVPQMRAADWKGEHKVDPDADKRLGLRPEDPSSANVSKASSLKSQEIGSEPGAEHGGSGDGILDVPDNQSATSLDGVKTTGPSGKEEVLNSTQQANSNVGSDRDKAKPSEQSISRTADEATTHASTTTRGDEIANKTAQKGFIVE